MRSREAYLWKGLHIFMNKNIEVCKWYNNADSPVLFMVDDLANVWVDTNGNGEVDLEEDWGYAKNSEKSSFRYLNDIILKQYPDAKVTFFTPVGVRVGMIENPAIKSVSKMINCDEETKEFFRNIHINPKFEIAYHGTSHGRVGKSNRDFKQEWELFHSLDEAVKVINCGRKIYKDVFGEYPKGGKYCGYEYNEYSDASIDSTDFVWWCRCWNRGAENYKKSLSNLDLKTFGKNNVIDIPSTVSGALLNGVLRPDMKTLSGKIKRLLRKILIKYKLNEINYLLRNRLVISIQEHMAPSRDDGRRQSPNIFDDRESLLLILKYLNKKSVWYCTGSELASYFCMRESIHITEGDNDTFNIGNPCGNIGKVSLKVTGQASRIELPNGQRIEKENGCFNVEVMPGMYRVIH